MSAYALPGSFFFPSSLDDSNDTVASRNDMAETSNSSNPSKEKDSWYTSSNDLLISIKSASIDHIRLIQGFTARRSSVSSRRSSFRDRVASLSNSLSGFSLASSFAEADEHWGEYMEEEEEEEPEQVKVDNLHTDKTKLPPSPRERKVQFQFDKLDNVVSNRRESMGSLDAAVCAASVCGEQATFPTLRGSSVHSNSQDDAIQFTLSITLNGRKYTATRALPSFVKLRKDLMQELEDKKSSPSRLQQGSGHIANDQGRKIDSLIHKDMEASRQDEEQVIIPELPIGGDAIDSDKSGGLIGMAGRGFRGLQDTVKNYCPPLEHWIRSVAALVPSSPTLANFLWEPLHTNQDSSDVTDANESSCANTSKPSHQSGGNRVSLRSSMRGSVQTLISITESADTDSDGSEVEKQVVQEESSSLDGKEEFVIS